LDAAAALGAKAALARQERFHIQSLVAVWAKKPNPHQFTLGMARL
jgi:hypothetical protein